jgi:hypothetical protein
MLLLLLLVVVVMVRLLLLMVLLTRRPGATRMAHVRPEHRLSPRQVAPVEVRTQRVARMSTGGPRRAAMPGEVLPHVGLWA